MKKGLLSTFFIDLKGKRNLLSIFFIDLEGQGPLPTYPWGIKTS